MGQEDEAEPVASPSRGYTVDGALMTAAGPTPCSCTACRRTVARRSPARSLDGPRSAIWRQAENRMHSVRGPCSSGSWSNQTDDRPSATHATTLGKPQRQHRITTLSKTKPCPEPGPARRAAGRRRGAPWPPRPRCRATWTTSGPSRCACPAAERPTPSRRCRRNRSAPEDHLRRVFGDWVVEVAHSGQPGRAAHAARQRPRRRVRPRPGRPARHPRYGRRRRHAYRGRLRAGRWSAGRRRA